MEKLMEKTDQAVCAVLVVLTTFILLVGIMQVFSRFVLQMSLSWSEELMRYVHVWITMLGVSLGIRRGAFAKITSFTGFLGKKSPWTLGRLLDFLTVVQAVFFACMVYYGFALAQRNMAQLSPAMRLPMGLVYTALPIGGLLGFLYVIFGLWERYKKRAAGVEA